MQSATLLSYIIVLLAVLLVAQVNAFGSVRPSGRPLATKPGKASSISMEYIPDGLSKKEWEQIKKREAEELKAKGNMGVLGVQRFKSRSLQAWQEAGGKHLFPVNPNSAKYEERPYMQRRGGDWEGTDLKQKGLQGSDQGTPYERSATDDRYDVYKKKGLLDSVSIFGKGAPLPWTSEAANAISKNTFNPDGKQGVRGVAGRKLSPEELEKLKKQLVKPIVSKKAEPTPQTVPAEPPKKRFGLF